MSAMQAPYEQLGEDGVRDLVDRFYDRMDALPEAKTVRDMHPPDLGQAREKLFWFLSGWLGGPPLYVERVGHPMLRARHLPFPIGDAERDQWMRCMELALEEVVEDAGLRAQLGAQLRKVADHMRNQPPLG
jgi:hemoglobin